MCADRDPYNALSVWHFQANRDPEEFLRLFEGVIPKVRGMEWSPTLGWSCVPEGYPVNMIWDPGTPSDDVK